MIHPWTAALGASAFLFCHSAVGCATQGAPARTTDTPVVVMLGTGTPRPLPEASGPATAVVVGGRVFLVDAGVGVERRLAAAGLPIDGVAAVFITHLHSDHVLGLPDLIFTSWVMGRTRPFPAYGPHGLARMTEHLYEAFSEDIRIRTEGLEHESREGYRIAVREIGPGVVYDSGGVRVTAFAVNHGEWREAYGYRFDGPGRSIVLSGDTRPSEELVRMATGVDVLIHEVQPSDSTKPPGNRSASEWASYVRSYHTTALQLGELAARARPKLLVVSHNGRRTTADRILADIRRSFSGPVVIAADLQRF
ncbi:MAG: MBL fold metallo-hydrolase [Gemmatimonadales bacterium]